MPLRKARAHLRVAPHIASSTRGTPRVRLEGREARIVTEAELLLRRAAYCRDLVQRARLQADHLADSDAERERLNRYLDDLEREALSLEKKAAACPRP